MTAIKDLPKHSDQLVLSVEEARKLLGISRGLAYEGIRTGQIPNIRIGRRILIPYAKLNKMLEGSEKEKTQS